MEYDYLFSARKRSGDVFQPAPGPISFLKVPRSVATYNPSHIIPPKTWVAEVQGLADGDQNPNSISPTGDVLIFVHGYNNDIAAVLQRQRTLRTTLQAEGWKGEIAGFDWPSGNNVLNYVEDRLDAAAVARLLVEQGITRLIQGQKAGCVTNVHLLGHSTGAYVILEAFAQAEKNGDLFKSDWRMGQVALIAGDVAQDALQASSDWSKPMFRRIMRLTNYSNGYDAVLAVSNAKRLGVSPRVGRVGLPAEVNPKAINVDCSAYFQGLKPDANAGLSWTHAWHFGNPVFARDLALSLEGAIDRHSIPTRAMANGKLTLIDAPRPAYQSAWGIKASAQYDQPRA